MLHVTEDVFSPSKGIFHYTRIFFGRIPIPTDGIFSPCGIFQKKMLQQGFKPVSPWLKPCHSKNKTIAPHINLQVHKTRHKKGQKDKDIEGNQVHQVTEKDRKELWFYRIKDKDKADKLCKFAKLG